jgi:RNA recognition motif-containing protein
MYLASLAAPPDSLLTMKTLRCFFQVYAAVESAQVIVDRDTGRSKGFGFIEMRNDKDAQKAIQTLNGQDFNGRSLTVNEARPREERAGGALQTCVSRWRRRRAA